MELPAKDAIELAEMLQFIRDWLTADGELDASLRRFVSTSGYDLVDLRDDLARFTLLLGGDHQGDDELTAPL